MNLLNLGVNQVFFDAVANGAQNSTAFALPTLATQVSWQTSFGSVPASVTLQLQTSLDNVVWSTIDTSTSTSGESRTVNTSALFVRVRENAVSGGSTTTVNVVCKSGVVGNVLTPSSVTDGSLALFDGTTGSKLKELAFPGSSSQVLKGDGTFGTVAGTGDVVGPSSATDNHVAFFNGTTGKLIKDSGLALSGTNTGDQFGSTTASKLLGRGSAGGTGVAQAIDLGTNLSMSGTTLNAAGGGGTPGGANTSIQFNNSSAFGGFGTWNGSLLTIPGDIKFDNLLSTPNGTNGDVDNPGTQGIDLFVTGGTGGNGNDSSALGAAVTITSGNGGNGIGDGIDGSVAGLLSILGGTGGIAGGLVSQGGFGAAILIKAGQGGSGGDAEAGARGGDLSLITGLPTSADTGDADGARSGNFLIQTPDAVDAIGTGNGSVSGFMHFTIGNGSSGAIGGDGGGLIYNLGTGGSGNNGAGGNGSSFEVTTGNGGSASISGAGGGGGAFSFTTGDGGAGVSGADAGSGGDMNFTTGAAGTASGGGSNGVAGNFFFTVQTGGVFNFNGGNIISDSNITAAIFIPTTGYKSVDLSTGITQDVTTGSLVGKTMIFKNGLLVGFA